jgi:putative effector of murein hydrolase LrgA (UPF0299 family)
MSNSQRRCSSSIIIIIISLFFLVALGTFFIPKGLQIVNYKSLSKSLGVSWLVVKNIMLLLKGIGKAYCIEALKSDRNELVQKARFARVIGDGGNPMI